MQLHEFVQINHINMQQNVLVSNKGKDNSTLSLSH